MPKLAITVHVFDPETGRTSVLNRGTEVEGRALALITNPDVWEDPESASEARAEFESGSAEQDSGSPQDASVEPPRAGAGSGREAWAKFAQAHSVHVEDEDKRDDIIAALVEAGVIDE
jgi:hypothetical protein